MFLFDPSFAADMSKVEQEVERVMQRAGAEIIMSNKWDERKLAYEIKGRKRGCYVLTFFRAESDKIGSIERDVQLSESILRVLILKRDYMTEEDMKQAYGGRGPQAASADHPPAKAKEGGAEGPGTETPTAPAAEAETTTAVAEAEAPAPEPAPADATDKTKSEDETSPQP
jgi:small subunit ribosomal protein S6